MTTKSNLAEAVVLERTFNAPVARVWKALTDVDEMREPVLNFETIVNFLDPTEELEISFRLADLVFPEPGDYRLQLFGAGQFLRERRFLVIPLENPGNP